MSVVAARASKVRYENPMDRFVTWLFRSQAAVVYAFLYLPIVIVVVYAFNENRIVERWTGFSTKWFAEAWNDDTLRRAFVLSVVTASVNALVATFLGTAAGIALRNVGRRTRSGFDAFMYTVLIVPEIVIALASLLFFVTIGLPLGPVAIVITHSVFNTSVVALIVRARLAGMDRTLEEASADLGAGKWSTFYEVTLPQLMPAVVSGALLSFTFSFDDVILSSFVSGPGSTPLPVELFSQLRFGLSPKINVVAVFTLSITLTAIVAAQLILRRSARHLQTHKGGAA
jgi:ABC-type spermidine/putrescine transport system permease subunit II